VNRPVVFGSVGGVFHIHGSKQATLWADPARVEAWEFLGAVVVVLLIADDDNNPASVLTAPRCTCSSCRATSDTLELSISRGFARLYGFVQFLYEK
jgi:hypothetical protein